MTTAPASADANSSLARSRFASLANVADPNLPAQLTRRERFLRACYCRPLDYPPIWLMRQAGRALPEYRALKEKYTFVQLVQNPELATEVTLQPVRRFDFDAAILFSDILVIPEALGQGYYFRESGGVQMEFTVKSAADIERLDVSAVVERLHYVDKALRLLRSSLADRTALLGFSGSPWTLANFMLEGGSADQPTRTLHLYQHDRPLFEALMAKLTKAIVVYLQMQIAAGVDGVQIFDSHGGLLPSEHFEPGSGRWIRDIVSALGDTVPVIVFSRGTHRNWPDLVNTQPRVLGIDWEVSLAEVKPHIPAGIAIQGNLDPALLSNASTEVIAAQARKTLDSMRGRPGHIFNLGHGLPPGAKLENIEALIATVRQPAR